MKYETLGVEGNMGLVHTVANSMQHILCQNNLMDYQDLVSEGVIGLMHALERFDPDRGYKFSSYAASCIRFYMYRGHRSLFKDKWKAREGGVNTLTISMDTEDDRMIRKAVGLDDRGQGARTTVRRIQRKQVWKQILSVLTPLQKEVVNLTLEDMAQAEIARHLGLSRQAINIRYQKAITRAREHFGLEEAV